MLFVFVFLLLGLWDNVLMLRGWFLFDLNDFMVCFFWKSFWFIGMELIFFCLLFFLCCIWWELFVILYFLLGKIEFFIFCEIFDKCFDILLVVFFVLLLFCFLFKYFFVIFVFFNWFFVWLFVFFVWLFCFFISFFNKIKGDKMICI